MKFEPIQAWSNMEPVRESLKSDVPKAWVFYGDSITHGAEHTYGGRDYPEHFEERLRYELPRKYDLVLNAAASGNTTVQLLENFSWRVARIQPHFVFLMIGYNDCYQQRVPPADFEKNLRKLCAQIEDIGAMPILQTANAFIPALEGGRVSHVDEYMGIIRNVAREKTYPLVDHYQYWQDNKDWNIFWLSDSIHPNTHGHIVMAKYLFAALGIYAPDSFVCSLFAPGKRS